MGNITIKNLSRVLLGLALCLTINKSQAITTTVKGAIPSVVSESSGLDYNGNASFWTHNDGFGDNRLYKVNFSGTLTQTITVTGATNYDWEDLTHDANRDYMFIGDFGNNNCDRTNLCVYRIPYPHTGVVSAAADAIHFSYPDQRSIPSPWMNFDVEAFCHFNGNIYLFTKTDGSAIGYTKMYMIPDNPGTYVATLVDSFYTNDRTTSADINADGTALVLISNSHIHVFKNFSGNNFFNGSHTQINISGSWTQKESVTFTSNNEIYLTDEDNGSGNNLYYVSLSGYIPAATTNAVNEIENSSASVYPNPASELVHFDLSKQFKTVSIQLYDITGKLVNSVSYDNSQQVVMNIDKYSPGIYFYKILAEGNLLKTERLIIQ